MKKAIIFFITCMFCTAVFAQSEKKLNKDFEESSVPADVLKPEFVLLVRIPYDTKKWISKFTRLMENHYTGKFEIVVPTTPVNGDYDVNKYKYILNVSNSTSSSEFTNVKDKNVFNPSGTGSVSRVRSGLSIRDRQTNKTYYSGLQGQDVMKILAFYADKLSGRE